MSPLACRLRILLACLLSLCWPGAASTATEAVPFAQVWQVGGQRWDVAAEQRYAQWVETEVDEDFFLRLGIAVDCADVPYALRWIYARLAHLPAAATRRDGSLLGHWSTAWAHLPTHPDWRRDRRFLAALLHVLDETTTKSLPADTYPIRIDPESLLAGTVTIVPEGHAGLVARIVRDGSMFSPVQTWEATLPRKVRKLRPRSYFSTWPDSTSGAGLARFRWPVVIEGIWRYLGREAHPDYSLEQYLPGFAQAGEAFHEAVARRIDPAPYSPTAKARLILASIHRYLRERVALVRAGYRHCQRADCREGSALWEVYSTPSRDAMIAFEIEQMMKIVSANGLDMEAFKARMEGLTLDIDEGQSVSVNHVVENYRWLSSEPWEPIAMRWGLGKCEMIRRRMLESLHSLDFVERRYRAIDPAFADSGRRGHLRDLGWLQEEGEAAGCTGLPAWPQEEARALGGAPPPRVREEERSCP